MADTTKKLNISGIWLVYNGEKTPVMDLRIDYMVGMFPVVTAVVNDGASNEIETVQSLDGGLSEPVYSIAKGAAAIRMDLAEYDVPITLFSGYIVERCPVLETSITTMQSRTRYKLICETELLNTVPPGSLRYYAIYDNKATTLSFGDAYALNFSNGLGLQLVTEFNESPSIFLAALLDHIRAPFSKKEIKSIKDSVIHAAGNFCTNVPPSAGGFVNLVARDAAPLLGARSPSAAYAALLANFWLGWLPQTVGSESETSRMIIRSVCGWDKTLKFQLKLQDIVGFNSVTSFNHTEFVDYYGVVIPPISTGQVEAERGTLVAVYGGGFGTPVKVMSQQEFNAAVVSQKRSGTNKNEAKAGLNTYASMRITTLPKWFDASLFAPKIVQKKEEETDTTRSVAVLSDYGSIRDAQKTVAERLAILSFLQNGRSATKATIRVPLYTWLRLLPHLGDTGSIDLINLKDQTSRDIKDLHKDTDTWFGGLNALGLSISVDNKALRITCTVGLNQLHTEKEQAMYGMDNPIYKNQDPYGGQNAAYELVETLGL